MPSRRKHDALGRRRDAVITLRCHLFINKLAQANNDSLLLEGNDNSTARDNETHAEPESNPFSILQKIPQVSYAD